MATAQNPTIADLHTRLDQLEERLAQIQSSGSLTQSQIEDDLSQFAHRHLAVRRLIDENATDGGLTEARLEVRDLESGLENWFKEVEEKFANPPPRSHSVSM